MQSPTKKRAGEGDHLPRRRVKRQATTPTRLTRSMLKRLNENGEPPVELNPGLEMGVRRRTPRARPPKRAAHDKVVAGSVKRTTSTRRKKGAPRAKKPKLKEPQPSDLQHTESLPAESILVEPQTIEEQPKERRPTKPQPGDHEKRVSEADVAAASRLAQAAIAAGLTGTTSETGTPVVEDAPSLVRFTKRDLEDLLNEVVVDDGIRQRMEPHWLARTEFLTWWERPIADMDQIKEQVRRLAIRWSKDLQAQNAEDVDIPTTLLESWQADIVIVGEPKVDTGDNEAENEGRKATEDKDGDENDQGGGDENQKEGETEEGKQEVKEQGDDKADEMAGAGDSHVVAEALMETLALALREMAEWKEAFDKEIATEPEFRSRRAWTERVLESQKEATALEETIRDLSTHQSGWTTSSAREAADDLLSELQGLRLKLRMDRAAFWDEFDQEGAELLLEKTKRGENAEGELQEDTQQGEMRETETDLETDLEAGLEAELEKELPVETTAGTETESGEEEDIQMVKIQAEKEDSPMTGIGERHDPSTGHGSVAVSGLGPSGPPAEVSNNDNDPYPTPARPEYKLAGTSTEGSIRSDQGKESTPKLTAPAIYIETKL